MAETTYAEPTTQVIPDIDYSPRTSGTLTPLDNNSNRAANGTSGVGIDGRSPQRSSPSATPDIIDAEWRDITPEPFSSPSEYAAQQRQQWARTDEQYIDDLRSIDDAYEQSIRDIDAATPTKGNRNPATVGRTAAGAAGAISGIGEAVDRRANGAGWGESIGAGVGNALGGITGGALGGKAGLAAGTASTANPVGAGVGLAVGGAVGGVAGSEIGAAIGGAIGKGLDNLFPGNDGNENGADNLSPVEGDAPTQLPDEQEGGNFSAFGGVRIEFARPWGQVSGFTAIEYGETPGRPGNLRIVSCAGVVFPLERYVPGSIQIMETGVCGAAPEQEPQTRPEPIPPTFPDAPAFRLPDFDFPGLPDLFGDRPPTSDPADRPRFEPIGSPRNTPDFPSPDFPQSEPEPAPKPTPQPTGEPLGDIPGGSPTTGSPGDTFSSNPGSQSPPPNQPKIDPTTSPDPIFSRPPDFTDFPSTGDDLEPINESPNSDLNENEQPKECDPCAKIDELTAFVQQALKDPDVLIASLQGCEDEDEDSRNFFSAGGRGLKILSSNQKVLIDLLSEVWEKVKCDSEVYASIPDSATFKVPAIVPQVSMQFKEVGNNKGSRWHITIPRFNEAFKDNLQPFIYQKGNYRCSLDLTDNSKIVVNSISEDEGRRVITYITQFVENEYLTPLDWIKVNKIPSRAFKEITVVSCHAKFFSGRLDEPPKWIRKIK